MNWTFSFFLKKQLFLKINLSVFKIYVCAYVCSVCVRHVCSVYEGQKKASGTRELKLQFAVCPSMWVLGTELNPGSLQKQQGFSTLTITFSNREPRQIFSSHEGLLRGSSVSQLLQKEVTQRNIIK